MAKGNYLQNCCWAKDKVFNWPEMSELKKVLLLPDVDESSPCVQLPRRQLQDHGSRAHGDPSFFAPAKIQLLQVSYQVGRPLVN